MKRAMTKREGFSMHNQFSKFFSICFLFLLLSCASRTKDNSLADDVKNEKQMAALLGLDQKKDINWDKLEGQGMLATVMKSHDDFMSPHYSKRVEFWISYFTKKRRDLFLRFLERGSKYRQITDEIFADYELPEALFYVGLIESGYSLKIKSHAGASGPWQFMPSTARQYGLIVNKSVDERHNILKATESAALYFRDLYNIFGSWELALSAYNAGENRIIRAIRKGNTRDYYELVKKNMIPKETQNYVPKVLAAMAIIAHPDVFGIDIPKKKEHLYQDTQEVKVKRSVSLAHLSQNLNLSLKKLQELNPEIKEDVTPSMTRRYFSFHLPKTDETNLREAILSYKGPSVASSSFYKVRRGDGLIRIARKFGMDLNELLSLNGLSRRSTVYPGQKLRVQSSGETLRYVVQRGDSLYKLAKTTGTSISNIVSMNDLKRKTIYPGQKLYLPADKKVHYTVRAGDYLEKIALKHGVSIHTIKKMNRITSSKIFPGQKLLIVHN